jgi:iron complex outermembrane recepter protein
MRIQHLLRSTASLAVLSAMACASAAHAQDEARYVDEIIVTAQKREQSLQDVPIVVTAVSGQLLQDTGVRDIKDLTVLTPGLLVTSTSNESVTTARVRGVGTVGDNPGLESSVGVVIDGVYRPRNGVGFGDLGELERIEVLKGTQGTLFGKNTSAGVINIITQAPSLTFGATSEATVGNYGAVGFSQSVTGPITDNLAGRIYAAVRKRDGFQDVETGGVTATRGVREDNNQDYYTVRGQLLWAPTAGFDVRVIGDYTERDEYCCAAVQLVNGPFSGIVRALSPGAGIIGTPDPDSRRTFSNRGTEQYVEDKGLSVEANWDTPWLGGATLTSVTAARNWRTVNGQDSDFSTADILYRDADGSFMREFEQFSQELRLAGETERLSWLVGAFYARELLRSRDTLNIGTQMQPYLTALFGALGVNGVVPAYTPGPGQSDFHKQTSDTWALFTNNSLRITDKLELTLGLRYTSEEKDLATAYRNLTGGIGGAGPNPCSPAALGAVLANPAVIAGGGANSTAFRLYAGYVCAAGGDRAFNSLYNTQSRSEEEFSGTAKLSYRFDNGIMAYASYARGYKAGGFNLDRARFTIGQPNLDTSFPAEFVNSYELGVKSRLFDRSLILNATAFHQEYENFQLNTFTGVAFVVLSVPEVKSTGVDADFVWFSPIEGFRMQGGVTYAITEYGSDRPDLPAFDLPGSARTPAGGGSWRLPGSRMSFAPMWSASLSGTYEREVGENLLFRANAGAKYTSAYNTGSDLAPQKRQGDLTLLNARIGLGDVDERWMFELWGNNLTDETYLQVAFDGTFQPSQVNAFLGAPRTFGATLRFKY